MAPELLVLVAEEPSIAPPVPDAVEEEGKVL
jgi:hypothetical protein